MRRALKPGGHLVLSYVNRDPDAWVALFAALQAAGFRTPGYEVVQSENDVDHAKAGRRACNRDVVLDLIPNHSRAIELHRPAMDGTSTEASFCHDIGRFALCVGALPTGWKAELRDALSAHPFIRRAPTSTLATDEQG